MLQFLKWPLHVKYAFFGRCVFSSKSTLFYRKKLFLVFSMCTKKVFCVWEVSRNRFFCILKQSDFNTEWMLFPIKMFYNKKSQRKNNVLGLKSRIGKKKGITLSHFYQIAVVIVAQDETSSIKENMAQGFMQPNFSTTIFNIGLT